MSRDPRTGAWSLEGWGRTHRLREWTWAERRCLVDACSPRGRLDGARFLRAMLDLLVEPAPPADATSLYGYVCLSLLEVPGAPQQSLTASEVALARAFGWGPRQLAEQPAAQVDRLLAHLAVRGDTGADRRPEPSRAGPRPAPPPSPSPSPSSPGSYSIVIVDDDSDAGGGRG
ncbi:hypothetical protein [Haliangium sp.]|uniref:hypothetical protein n=1 Tax=Haliangium sp. TaxID=2663208 RepID=UPI003D14BF68